MAISAFLLGLLIRNFNYSTNLSIYSWINRWWRKKLFSWSKAGKIEITGKEISIHSGSNVLAKGAKGGGEILIGGDWQGKGSMQQAIYTTVEKDTLIDASSTKTGDGGKIVIWSDIKDKNSVTKVDGTLKAKSIDFLRFFRMF